jgi:hypothetical protein
MISLRAYARHRGISVVAVSRAVKAGRLRASVARDHRGHPKIADVGQADAEWTQNTDLSRAPGYVKARGDQGVQTSAHSTSPPAELPDADDAGPDTPDDAGGAELTLSQASAEEKRWKAKLAELQYKQRSGELVDAKEMADSVAHVFTVCRTKLLALPSKAKAAIPHLTHAEVTALDAIVRQALEELADVPIVATSSGSGAAA